jgi:hypothetical protein
MATRIVVGVIPVSLAGTVLVGAGDDEVGGVDAVPPEAAWVDEVPVEAAGVDVLLLLAELHPAASRTAAASAAISPAYRARLGIRGPVPPRPGPSLLGLTRVPSTTPLPVSF